MVSCGAPNTPDSFWEHQNCLPGDQNPPRTQVCRVFKNDDAGIHLKSQEGALLIDIPCLPGSTQLSCTPPHSRRGCCLWSSSLEVGVRLLGSTLRGSALWIRANRIHVVPKPQILITKGMQSSWVDNDSVKVMIWASF